ncbi:MAG: PIN domain-containing protein [Chloroflexota bacterium]
MKISDALQGISLLSFDTSPLIYFVEQHPIYFDRMKAIMSYIDDQAVSGISSGLTLTEILTFPIRLGKISLVNRYEEILLNTRGFHLAPIDVKTCRTAADLRARHNLKTPDALQVAAALEANCDAFLTNDLGIKRVTEIRVLVLDELELDES